MILDRIVRSKIDEVEGLRGKKRSLAAALAGPGVTVIAEVKKLTGGYGCDVYIEASGHPSAVGQGLQLIKKGGRFVEFSVFSAPATVDWSLIGDAKEIDIYGVSLSPFCFERSIGGIADGSLGTQGIVTHVLPLSDFKKSFELSKKREGLKVALVP